MKWYAALIVGLALSLITFSMVRISDKNDTAMEQLQKEVAQLKQDQEETRKAAAVYEAVAKQVINGEW